MNPLLEAAYEVAGVCRERSLRHRTLLLQASNGIPVDVALGALPFEERAADLDRLHAILDRP
jgi:hypothetical protein